MVGAGFIQSELDISKILELHKGWRVLISGDDITPVFDILDYAKEFLKDKGISGTDNVSLQFAMDAIRVSQEKKRIEEAEALFLTPTGWDIASFNAAGHNLPDFGEIKSKIDDYSLPIEIMVAGFSDGHAYIFSLSGTGPQKGLIQRHDIPGFYAIGSGAYGALFMLYYREMSFREKVRAAAYYTMEAKLFGEQAGGVGEGTDMYVATAEGKHIPFDEDGTIEAKLVRVWGKLRPRWFGKESSEILNSIGELKGFPKLEVKKKRKKKESKKTTPSDSQRSEDKANA
jgi:hypothetical protein